MTCGPLQVPTSVKKRGLFKKITVNQIHAMFRKKNKSEELDTSAFVTPIEEKAEDTPTKGAINFHINGESYSIKDPDPSLLLVDYLRSTEVGLTGTKHPCGQGGCGGCTVMLSYFDQHKESVVNVSINSCLRPVASLDGMEITTVEGLGSVDSEVSPVQYAIAKNNGSQCGYCTPGFVMNMHSLLIEKDGQELTKNKLSKRLTVISAVVQVLDPYFMP